MNYPVWYLPETGGGFLIALIAILHVFVSHFAEKRVISSRTSESAVKEAEK